MCFGQVRKGSQYYSSWRSKGRWCLVRTKQKGQFSYFWNLLGTCRQQRNLCIIKHWFFDRNVDADLVDMERARMKVTRVCVYHVDRDAAMKSHGIIGEIFADVLFKCICHQVTIVGGDTNRLSYQKAGKQLNSSYSMLTCQFWTERMEHTMVKYFKTVLQKTSTLMSDSSTPFYIWMWNIFMRLLVDVWIWKKMFVRKLIVLVFVVFFFFFNMVYLLHLKYVVMGTTMRVWSTSILWMNLCFIWQIIFCYCVKKM